MKSIHAIGLSLALLCGMVEGATGALSTISVSWPTGTPIEQNTATVPVQVGVDQFVFSDGSGGTFERPLMDATIDLKGGTLEFLQDTILYTPLVLYAASTIQTNGYTVYLAGSLTLDNSLNNAVAVTVEGSGRLTYVGEPVILTSSTPNQTDVTATVFPSTALFQGYVLQTDSQVPVVIESLEGFGNLNVTGDGSVALTPAVSPAVPFTGMVLVRDTVTVRGDVSSLGPFGASAVGQIHIGEGAKYDLDGHARVLKDIDWMGGITGRGLAHIIMTKDLQLHATVEDTVFALVVESSNTSSNGSVCTADANTMKASALGVLGGGTLVLNNAQTLTDSQSLYTRSLYSKDASKMVLNGTSTATISIYFVGVSPTLVS